MGVESAYGAVCRSFNKLAFQDDDSEHSFTLQEKDMIEVNEKNNESFFSCTNDFCLFFLQHFQSFARSSEGTNRPNGFESHMVYRGYIDDIRNTDNAWVEAEIWNFHYGSSMSFPNLRTDVCVDFSSNS